MIHTDATHIDADSNSTPTYSQYAFHETAKGVLTGHFAEPTANGIPLVEPFLNRKGEFDKTRGFESAALLTAGAWLSRERDITPNYSIEFNDVWTGTAAQLSAWEPASGPASEHATELTQTGTHEITRRLSLTGEALNAWLSTPPERAAAYLQHFSQVSLDIQIALRRWLPYLLLRDEAIINQAPLRNSLLFYAATRPYLARVRGVFTWDVICPDSMASVYRSGGQNLSVVMDQAQRYALAAGRLDLAEQLAPSEMRQVMIHVRRDPRALKGLLAIEGKLVEALLALGDKSREIAGSKAAPKNLHRFCSDWAGTLQSKLRRVLGPVACPQLVDLVLLEGTTSLAKCLGIQPERRDWTAFCAADATSDICGNQTQLPRAA